MEFRIEDAERICGRSVGLHMARIQSEVPSFGRRLGLVCL
jgi:hypothetical protein